jgi:N-acetylmuramoyl-L-alanine amidase-like protein
VSVQGAPLDLEVLHLGGKSEQCRALASAMNRRFENRSLEDRKVHVFEGPMTLTRELFDAAVTCAWALGASRATLKAMERKEIVPVGVARMIRNPGLRTDEQKQRGQRRIANMRKQRQERDTQPKFVTAAGLGLTFQYVFGTKGNVVRGAGHYTAGRRASNASELAAEMRSDHRFHKAKGWGGLSYEAMVADDGTIGFGNPMNRKSAAVASMNTGMVNICCPGTTGHRMTAAQKKSVKWLMNNWHTSAVPAAHRLPKPARSFGWKGHRFYPGQSTACPGVMINDYKEVW